jgi:hypothetical protein
VVWAVQVRRLLRAGADVNARDSRGRTALWWALEAGFADTVAVLVEAGADVNAGDAAGMAPLHAVALVADGDAMACARILLAQDELDLAAPCCGTTVSACARKWGHPGVAELVAVAVRHRAGSLRMPCPRPCIASCGRRRPARRCGCFSVCRPLAVRPLGCAAL